MSNLLLPPPRDPVPTWALVAIAMVAGAVGSALWGWAMRWW